ncbi:hypothetical protein BU14_0099s0025 [Porphyra umbilicalis]|uniref:Uncharacterized protein n=1 Tax=Porphyra umbilicalis TaxID=2786 RepID=A0A1X6PCW8_PORUM|nr:hypothetical protein BU14_0099s0025 [Porphyra umbilicalis]|eukprot:OSX78759.1 hypothetical protein BU14_0099s0025 [Porphyra umbilicalis]
MRRHPETDHTAKPRRAHPTANAAPSADQESTDAPPTSSGSKYQLERDSRRTAGAPRRARSDRASPPPSMAADDAPAQPSGPIPHPPPPPPPLVALRGSPNAAAIDTPGDAANGARLSLGVPPPHPPPPPRPPPPVPPERAERKVLHVPIPPPDRRQQPHGRQRNGQPARGAEPQPPRQLGRRRPPRGGGGERRRHCRARGRPSRAAARTQSPSPRRRYPPQPR